MAKRMAVLLAAGMMVVLAGCGGGQPRTDVRQYFGKTGSEIKTMLGEPATPTEMDRFSAAGLIYRAEECTGLPPLFVELKFAFSDAGHCRSMIGITKGFDTPEALLESVGLGGLERELISQDQLGFNYRMPGYALVQVHRPSSLSKSYNSFTATISKESEQPDADG